MNTGKKVNHEKERMRVANAIPWGLLKTEKVFLPIWAAIFIAYMIRQAIGFNYGGKWIMGLPAPVFESYAWAIGLVVMTIIATTFWIREVKERMRKAEKEDRK
ncbi:MAG: hypothetical protein J7L19_01750 [Dehalococcoidia bacterium]|nr:hypothetical protein [Dehalococcoidia bacterium]